MEDRLNSKQILVIGSAVVDVIIELEDPLPRRGEDVHVRSQKMQMGGCGFNTFHTIRHFRVPVIPFFPVGTGAYGNFVREEFRKHGIETPIPPAPSDNGCCYCFVEPDGERTFISYHGAEYRFQSDWFSLLTPGDIHSIYICGLEIEEPTGPNIVSFLENLQERSLRLHVPGIPVFFSPGPRLGRIEQSLMDRLYKLHPILHLNEEEACASAGTTDLRRAASVLFGRTGNTVIITLGNKGVFSFDGQKEYQVPAVPVAQADTIGAGDSHIGAVMAALYQGSSLKEALTIANKVSSKVVSVSGALLRDEEFRELGLRQSAE